MGIEYNKERRTLTLTLGHTILIIMQLLQLLNYFRKLKWADRQVQAVNHGKGSQTSSS